MKGCTNPGSDPTEDFRPFVCLGSSAAAAIQCRVCEVKSKNSAPFSLYVFKFHVMGLLSANKKEGKSIFGAGYTHNRLAQSSLVQFVGL